MTKYQDFIDELGTVESFDHRAFLGDRECPAAVCEFVLALALAFNDLKDLITVHRGLKPYAPDEERSTLRHRGLFNGHYEHFFRALIGCVNAICELIAGRRTAVESAAFITVLNRADPAIREMWAEVCDEARGVHPHGSRFGRMLSFVRNKLTSHYEVGPIAQGYRQRFTESDRPMLSRGWNMAGTRFYFADAAAQKTMWTAAGVSDAVGFAKIGWEVIESLAHTLREIVTTFIVWRVRSFREESEQ